VPCQLRQYCLALVHGKSIVVLFSLAVKPGTALSGQDSRRGAAWRSANGESAHGRGAVRRTRVSPSVGEQVARAHAQSRSTHG
jgi:hypothetical protein